MTTNSTSNKQAEEWRKKSFATKKKNIIDDFDKPVVDERIVRLNEIINVKLSSVSGKRRDSLRVAKTAANIFWRIGVMPNSSTAV